MIRVRPNENPVAVRSAGRENHAVFRRVPLRALALRVDPPHSRNELLLGEPSLPGYGVYPFVDA